MATPMSSGVGIITCDDDTLLSGLGTNFPIVITHRLSTYSRNLFHPAVVISSLILRDNKKKKVQRRSTKNPPQCPDIYLHAAKHKNKHKIRLSHSTLLQKSPATITAT